MLSVEHACEKYLLLEINDLKVFASIDPRSCRQKVAPAPAS